RSGGLVHIESAHAYPSGRTEIQFAGIGIAIRAFVVSVGVYRASQIDGITGIAVDLDLAVPDIASRLSAGPGGCEHKILSVRIHIAMETSIAVHVHAAAQFLRLGPLPAFEAAHINITVLHSARVTLPAGKEHGLTVGRKRHRSLMEFLFERNPV